MREGNARTQRFSLEALLLVLLASVVAGALFLLLSSHTDRDVAVSCTKDPVVAYKIETGEVKTASSCDVLPGWAIQILPDTGAQYKDGTTTLQRFREESLGVSTVYRASPEGYTLLQEPSRVRDSSYLRMAYVLVRQSDLVHADALLPREGPVSMHIVAYENPRNLSLLSWLTEFAGVAQYRRELGLAQGVTVGGKDALRFMGDGLYPTESFVVAHRSQVIIFSGSFDGPNDPMRKDFLDMVGAVAFF